VPLVFFHFCRRWTSVRDDACTADNAGIVSLPQALPVVTAPPQAIGGTSTGGSTGDSSSGDGKRGGPGQQASRCERDRAAGGGGLQGLPGDVVLDVEMSAASASSTPVLESAAAGSQQSGAIKAALSALADLPRRLSSNPGSASLHRRTDSTEPVLGREDESVSSLGA
jgi:hypothetical protein